ncbi:uncharacterized protein V6R79_001589 [Siganus canaliculatus]
MNYNQVILMNKMMLVFQMPRGKSYKRSLAAKRRCAIAQEVTELVQPRDDSPLGTGFRHAVLPWPTSLLTGKPCKLVIPDVSATQKFALVVGDSHLRHLVDGFVPMPEGVLAFGMLSVPGGRASQIKTEVLHAEVPQTPDVVCLLAPSNNLTASQTAEAAGAEFEQLLYAVCERWPKVCVLDFVPRLTIEAEVQEFYRQEFRRVAARLGVRYYPLIDHFPWDRRELWEKYGVHLSDTHGMPILAQLLWAVCYHHMTTEASTAQAAPTMSPPRRNAPAVSQSRRKAPAVSQSRHKAPAVSQSRRRAPDSQSRRKAPAVSQSRHKAPAVSQSRRRAPDSQSRRKAPAVEPQTVEKGSGLQQSDPFQWTVVRQQRKRKLSGKGVSSPEGPKKRMVHQQPDGSSITLKECFIPLNPVRFSRDMLDVLDDVDELHYMPQSEKVRKAAVMKVPSTVRHDAASTEVLVSTATAPRVDGTPVPKVGKASVVNVPSTVSHDAASTEVLVSTATAPCVDGTPVPKVGKASVVNVPSTVSHDAASTEVLVSTATAPCVDGTPVPKVGKASVTNMPSTVVRDAASTEVLVSTATAPCVDGTPVPKVGKASVVNVPSTVSHDAASTEVLVSTATAPCVDGTPVPKVGKASVTNMPSTVVRDAASTEVLVSTATAPCVDGTPVPKVGKASVIEAPSTVGQDAASSSCNRGDVINALPFNPISHEDAMVRCDDVLPQETPVVCDGAGNSDTCPPQQSFPQKVCDVDNSDVVVVGDVINALPFNPISHEDAMVRCDDMRLSRASVDLLLLLLWSCIIPDSPVAPQLLQKRLSQDE